MFESCKIVTSRSQFVHVQTHACQIFSQDEKWIIWMIWSRWSVANLKKVSTRNRRIIFLANFKTKYDRKKFYTLFKKQCDQIGLFWKDCSKHWIFWSLALASPVLGDAKAGILPWSYLQNIAKHSRRFREWFFGGNPVLSLQFECRPFVIFIV